MTNCRNYTLWIIIHQISYTILSYSVLNLSYFKYKYRYLVAFFSFITTFFILINMLLKHCDTFERVKWHWSVILLLDLMPHYNQCWIQLFFCGREILSPRGRLIWSDRRGLHFLTITKNKITILPWWNFDSPGQPLNSSLITIVSIQWRIRQFWSWLMITIKITQYF